MINKINIICNDTLWKEFFLDILFEDKYNYSKYNFKILLKDNVFNNEKISLGIIFRFKKINNNIYGEFIFGLDSDKNISDETVINIKNKISDFISIQNTLETKEKNIFFTDEILKETGCGILNFSLSENYSRKLSTNVYFKISLKLIYEFFYFDILNLNGEHNIEIDDPKNLEDIKKNKLKVPDWLYGSGLEKPISSSKVPKLSLQDMGGNKSLKIEISKLIGFYKNKDHFKKWNIEPPRGVILYGPPGTGKTLTAKIIANEIGVNFYTLSSSDIMEKWIGESARNIKKFFKELKYPCIVFLDEIDALVPKRDSDKSGKDPHLEEIQVINTLLQEIDGFGEKNDILFIGATNRIDSIDPAILRAGRLDYKIFIDYPDLEARKEIWGIYLKKAKEKSNYNFLDEHVDLGVLAKNTDKFTGSDISEIVRRLLNDYAIGSLVSNKVSQIVGGETTFKGLLYLIDKYKEQKITNKALIPLKPELKLSDIGGSYELKKQISLLIKQYKDREIYEKMGATLPRGILLYGPPGTGKTLAAKVIAGEIGQIFYYIKASDIQSSILNRSVENLKSIFEQIETPSIVFIDEIDSLARNRNGEYSTSEEDKKILNMLLQYIDGFGEKRDILFIGATNTIESIDPAILRAGRMDYKIFVDYPDLEARVEIWNIYIKKAKEKTNYNFLNDELNILKLAQSSQNFTGSDIAEITRRLLNEIAIGNLSDLREKSLLDNSIIEKNILEMILNYKKEKIFNNDILPSKSQTKLSDIGGSKILKEELEKIINQYKNKEFFEELGINSPKGILLYGPPGTGKTLAAKALAGEIGQIFYTLKGSDFLSQWTNGSVEKLDKIFKNFQTPCIVFIDEIDAIAKNRDKFGGIPEEDIKVLNTFLQYIDGFGEKKDILFLGATNRIEALDKAILRAGRFDTKVFVDYPDFEARIEIWKIYIEKSKTKSKKQSIFEDNIDYPLLSEKSEKMTGADIAEIIRRVKEEFAINESKNINLKSKIKLINTIKLTQILDTLEKYNLENSFANKDNKRIGFDF